MTGISTESRSVVLERQLPHPPEKVWRALTQQQLLGEWLMKTDFQPEVGHSFTLKADWGTVACKILEIEPNRTLVYSWVAYGLDSVVRWTLSPTATGTSLRMQQTGFEVGQDQFYEGAQAGWPRFLAALEELLARMA